MARKAREKSDSGIYHVLLRSGAGLFLDSSDIKYFEALLEKYFKKEGNVRLLGRRMAKNSVHLIADVKKEDISSAVKPLCTAYARYFNRVHQTSGKLFGGRFKSEPVLREDIPPLIRFLYREDIQEYFSDSLIDKYGDARPQEACRRLFMDDYANMDDGGLLDIMEYIVGNDFFKMSAEDKLSAVLKADADRLIRIGRVKSALGLENSKAARPGKARQSGSGNSEEKGSLKEEKKPQKKELSVWLL